MAAKKLTMKDLEKITKDHIRQAAGQINPDDVPTIEQPREYYVIVDGKKYPGPHLVRKAFELAYRYETPGPKKNLGPHLALPKLRKLGFQIVDIEGKPWRMKQQE